MAHVFWRDEHLISKQSCGRHLAVACTPTNSPGKFNFRVPTMHATSPHIPLRNNGGRTKNKSTPLAHATGSSRRNLFHQPAFFSLHCYLGERFHYSKTAWRKRFRQETIWERRLLD
ncbi:hypothetical protein CEXT_781701 [Caerostris extrusa]|uniref:Uncharacterized protein n=1 Tax=Caerostris extrusa TaxID=172846 RepID=A0AAV4XIE4_CAEEX|nr:hypothetical protein CEXT_781701 [Caerostris extrusa]